MHWPLHHAQRQVDCKADHLWLGQVWEVSHPYQIWVTRNLRAAGQDVDAADAAPCDEHQGRTVHHPVSAATASILHTVGSSWLESPPWIWGSWQREQAEVGPPQAWFWSSCHCCGCYINSRITNITELRGSEWKHALHTFGPHCHPSYLPFPHSYIKLSPPRTSPQLFFY